MKKQIALLLLAVFLSLAGCSTIITAQDIPAPGEVLQPGQVMAWLERDGTRPDLIKRLQAHVPERLFVSDGCSGPCPQTWQGKSLYPACFTHDIGYWLGGSPLDKLHDDARLMLDVADITGDIMWAQIMFNSVRAAGNTPGVPWQWGKVGITP